MPVMIDKNKTLYKTFIYEKEVDFETTVVEMADLIFGPSTIYIDVKKRMKGNDIISIPDLPESSDTAEEEIPDWIKNNAAWWSQGLISDDDFVKGIQYLVEQGIIKV